MERNYEKGMMPRNLSQTRNMQIRRAWWQLQDIAINTQIVHSQADCGLTKIEMPVGY